VTHVVHVPYIVEEDEDGGFAVTRTSGSHHVMRHPDGRSVSVPVYVGKDVPKGTLRGILTAVGITPDEFRSLL
jgi:predicted RNA binding protein YcfA (HicA-like mRNA interferase family)